MNKFIPKSAPARQACSSADDGCCRRARCACACAWDQVRGFWGAQFYCILLIWIILFFAVTAAVDFFFFVCEYEYLVELLFY